MPGSSLPPEATVSNRRPRGTLEDDVKVITDKFVAGDLALPDGATLTPHFIGRAMKELDTLESAPSTGAVNAVLIRWRDCGYATMTEKPFGFADYTLAARTEGLAALKATASAGRRATRQAARAAEKAAVPAAVAVSA